MHLQPGVTLRLQNVDVDDRIALSAGTVEAVSTEEDPFLPGARLAGLPWRSPSRAEYQILLDDSQPFSPGNCVAITRPPQAALEPLRKFGLEAISTFDEYDSLYSHPQHRATLEEVLRLLAEYYCVRNDRNQVLVMSLAYPNQASTAIGLVDRNNPKSERAFMGLHLDTATDIPIAQLGASRNRLCVNIGRAHRYLLMINKTALEMFTLLFPDRVEEAQHRFMTTRLDHQFMRAYADYPVIRVKINPGEAYVAPTDNIIHDGSTPNGSYPDLAIHFLGDFSV